MHSLRLFTTLLKVNIQQELAYRADTLINMALSVMWLGWELLSLGIIFSNTATLGGWGPGDLLALLGVWRLVNTLLAAIIWPNTERFNASIRDGTLDYTLLMPVNSLLLISLTRIVIWRAWDLLLGAGLIIAGVTISGGGVTPLNLLSFLALTASGTLVIYSLWVALIACTF